MYKLIVENSSKEGIELSHNPNFTIISIEGLNPPTANINMTKLATMHGSRKNNVSIPTRNIIMTIKINAPVDKNRMLLYKYFKTGEENTIYFKNDVRDVFISGTVESIEGSLFINDEQLQISILCEQPFFKDIAYFVSEIAKILGLFEFPFEIEEGGKEFSFYDEYRVSEIMNTGDTNTGFLITVYASGLVSNPTIWNSSTREFFKVNVSLNEGDVLEINTVSGDRYVRITQNGEIDYENIINKKGDGSTWLQLAPGLNFFTYTVNSGDDDINITFTGYSLFGGV